MVAFKKSFALIFGSLLHSIYYLKIGRNRKEITNSIRKLIIFHHNSGKSIRNIAKLVNLIHSTVRRKMKIFTNT